MSRKRIVALATTTALCVVPIPAMAQPADPAPATMAQPADPTPPAVMSSVNGIPITLDTLGAVVREFITYLLTPTPPANTDGQPECYTITWSQSGPATTDYLCLPQLPQIPSPWKITW